MAELEIARALEMKLAFYLFALSRLHYLMQVGKAGCSHHCACTSSSLRLQIHISSQPRFFIRLLQINRQDLVDKFRPPTNHQTYTLFCGWCKCGIFSANQTWLASTFSKRITHALFLHIRTTCQPCFVYPTLPHYKGSGIPPRNPANSFPA